MARKVILTCAVTGGAAMSKNSKFVPITPKQIADEAISATNAGASVVHIHVRDPKTGAASMKLEYYEEVVERIRASGTKAVINLTAGPGARYAPPVDNPAAADHICSPAERVAHVIKLKPEICTLDIATMNFNHYAIVNIPEHLKVMAAMIREAGVKPELEVFDVGHMRLAVEMVKRGDLPPNPLFQFCLGIAGGAPANTETMMLMRGMLPPNAMWAGFGIARMQMPMIAQATILGGFVRVGLEDNLFLAEGVLSEGNAPLVERAVQIVQSIGEDIATPDEARQILGLST